MKVTIIFDPAFSGQADEAVWIVNSSANRDWFERQMTLAVGSALFTIDRYPSLEEAAINMVWNAQEHHSTWKTISVEGIALTPRITEALAHEGRIIGTPAGFALHRA